LGTYEELHISYSGKAPKTEEWAEELIVREASKSIILQTKSVLLSQDQDLIVGE
jgi:hypothetical protein